MGRFGTLVTRTNASSRQLEKVAQSSVKMAAGMDVGGSIGGGDMGMFAGGGKSSKRKYELFHSWVFVCIRAIAQRVSGQSLHVGKISGAEANRERRALPYSKGSRPLSTKEAMNLPKSIKQFAKEAGNVQLELFDDHEIIDMMMMPNPAQDRHAFFFQTLTNYYLTGVSYWIYGVGKTVRGKTRPEVWAVPTHWVTPKHEGGLFTGYDLKVSELSEPISIDPSHVGRFYFPDPADLKSSISPVETQIEAVVTDRHIQKSQEVMFENGIYPSIVLKIGRNIGPDGTPMESRPVLTSKQRRQVITGIKKVWGGVSNFGDPAIVDGLIEGIERLQASPREMDWQRSGETVKKRIFQMFGLNPITVGEITAGNRAQAVEAEKNLANGVINPLIDGLSNVMTRLLGPLWDAGERLLVYLEEHNPIDPELELKRWSEARKNGDVTRDEYRANVLCLPPMEEEETDDELINQDDPAEAPPDGDDVDGDTDEEQGKAHRLEKHHGQLTRGGIRELHVKQATDVEQEVEAAMRQFFRPASKSNGRGAPKS